MRNRLLLAGLLTATTLGLACSESTGTNEGPGQGTLEVRLADRPLWFDSVAAVNVFVVRIDARVAVADSAECDVRERSSDAIVASDHDDGGMSRRDSTVGDSTVGDSTTREPDIDFRWQTIATPDTTFDLLALQNGVTAFLGTAVVDTGQFRALRIVIDPSKSSIVLKDGTVLTGNASPFARFPSAERVGIKILLNDGVRIRARHHSILVVDFDLENSFVLRGSLFREGLLFKPVVRATTD